MINNLILFAILLFLFTLMLPAIVFGLYFKKIDSKMITWLYKELFLEENL